MKLVTGYQGIWLVCSCWIFTCIALSGACDTDSDCRYGYRNDEKCCHGTCISKKSVCISGAAIAGIVVGCLIIGGIIISCCLCFCCACGPFQRRSQGTVIRYGGQATQTTTTGVSTHHNLSANVQTGYGASYPQPVSMAQYTSDGKYHQTGAAPYPSTAQSNPTPYPATAYPPAAPPSYDEANNSVNPPPYNPGYPQ